MNLPSLCSCGGKNIPGTSNDDDSDNIKNLSSFAFVCIGISLCSRQLGISSSSALGSKTLPLRICAPISAPLSIKHTLV